MFYDDYMIPRDEYGPNFLTFVFPGINLKQKTGPTRDLTRAQCVILPLEHSGGPFEDIAKYFVRVAFVYI